MSAHRQTMPNVTLDVEPAPVGVGVKENTVTKVTSGSQAVVNLLL